MKNLTKLIFILSLGIFLSAERNANAQTSTYNYTGSTQTFTVPSCVNQVTIKVWGAGGGGGSWNGYYGYELGGASGAYYTGVMSGLSSGTVLNVTVPSGGQFITCCGGAPGGWPGGGQGGNDDFYGEEGGGGGGYASVDIGGTYYVVVGGGGGGGSWPGYPCQGGGGGAVNGDDGAGSCCGGQGYGGNISFGGGTGSFADFCDPATSGSFLTGGAGGGTSCSGYYGGGGGGAGYYGGGGGTDYGGGGGGGSSYPGGVLVVGGVTFTPTSNLLGTDGGYSVASAPGGPPAGIGEGGYQSDGGNGLITITYIVDSVNTVNGNVITEVSCPGGNNGSASAIVTGIPPYTYSWSDPSSQTTDTATGLTVGTYTVTVNGCTGLSKTASVTITQAPALTGVTANVINNVFCNGGSNGSAYAVLAGGGPPFTYTWTPAGGSTDTASGLTAGTYTVMVTDFCGTTASASASISQPATALTLSVTTTANELCFGDAIGSASSSVSGGGTPYTYLWSPSGGNGPTANGLTAGTYTLNLVDNNGCTLSASTTITQAAVLNALAFTNTNVDCFGNTNGSTSSFTSGGTTPYTYSWAPSGGNAGTASGLSAGTYTLNVTDNHGCTATAATTITQPAAALNVTASTTANETCHAGNNGSASSITSGGTSPYTYSWAPAGGSTDTAVGLTAGTYTLSVTDNHGCSASSSTTITQPGAVVVTATNTANVICRGGFSGSASSHISGGTAPFTYAWTGGAGHTDTATGLSAGTYSLTVTDNHGCTGTASVAITQPNALGVSTGVTADVSCNGGSNGSALATASGGTTAYTYSWFPSGGTNASATGLTAGTYTVTLNDACSNSATASVTITQTATVDVSASTTGNVLCHGSNSGSASSIVSGGTLPYTYAWTGGGTNSTATGLSAGTYTLTVHDKNGCAGSATTTLTQPTALIIAADSTPDNGKCNGSAWVTVEGGTTPYAYKWSDAHTTTTFNITNECHGHYCCVVTDGNGCKDSVCIDINTDAGVAGIISNEGQITLYPNPNNGQFTISASGVSGQSSVEIYNMLGEKVYSQLSTLDSQLSINLSNQPNGVYLYRIMTETGNLLGEGKLIIQK